MTVLLRGLRVERGTFTLEIDAELAAPCTALLGPSGSGKTTFLEAVAGLVRPSAGTLSIDGDLVDDAGPTHVPAWRRRVGYVPQEGALFPHLSVRRNLLYGSDDDARLAHVAGVLEIGGLLDRRVQGLSGGEQRRVALGRALLAGPRLLLLDEPMTGLDRRLKQRAMDLLARIRSELRTPTILVTHDEHEARALADEAAYLDAGRLVAREPTARSPA